ncbi:MAG: DUF3566 domain-containing protein [Actinomycetota bacterium]
MSKDHRRNGPVGGDPGLILGESSRVTPAAPASRSVDPREETEGWRGPQRSSKRRAARVDNQVAPPAQLPRLGAPVQPANDSDTAWVPTVFAEPPAPVEQPELLQPTQAMPVIAMAEPAPTPAPAPAPAPRQVTISNSSSKRRARRRVRRVTRVVRHVDPWSVFKVALAFSVVLYGVCLTAGVLLWNVAYTTGTIDNVQKFFESFGWSSFRFKGGELFHNAWIAGLFACVGLTGMALLAATLFNLITDLVGGIRVSVLEEEVVERHPATTKHRSVHIADNSVEDRS